MDPRRKLEPDLYFTDHARDIRITAGQRNDFGAYHNRPANYKGPDQNTSMSSQQRGVRIYDPVGGTWTRNPVKDDPSRTQNLLKSRIRTPQVTRSLQPQPGVKRRATASAPTPAPTSSNKRPRPATIDLTDDDDLFKPSNGSATHNGRIGNVRAGPAKSPHFGGPRLTSQQNSAGYAPLRTPQLSRGFHQPFVEDADSDDSVSRTPAQSKGRSNPFMKDEDSDEERSPAATAVVFDSQRHNHVKAAQHLDSRVPQAFDTSTMSQSQVVSETQPFMTMSTQPLSMVRHTPHDGWIMNPSYGHFKSSDSNTVSFGSHNGPQWTPPMSSDRQSRFATQAVKSKPLRAPYAEGLRETAHRPQRVETTSDDQYLKAEEEDEDNIRARSIRGSKGRLPLVQNKHVSDKEAKSDSDNTSSPLFISNDSSDSEQAFSANTVVENHDQSESPEDMDWIDRLAQETPHNGSPPLFVTDDPFDFEQDMAADAMMQDHDQFETPGDTAWLEGGEEEVVTPMSDASSDDNAQDEGANMAALIAHMQPTADMPATMPSATPVPAVPSSMRYDMPTVTEDSRVKHAEAGSSRYLVGRTTKTGFAFDDASKPGADTTVLPKSFKEQPRSETEQTRVSVAGGPTSLQGLAVSSPSDEESSLEGLMAIQSSTDDVEEIPDSVLRTMMVVSGKSITVRDYIRTAVAKRRHAESIRYSLTSILAKSGRDLEITNAQVRAYVKQEFGVDIPLKRPKGSSTTIAFKAQRGCRPRDPDDKVRKTIQDPTFEIDILDLTDKMKYPPRPQIGQKTLPAGYRSQLLDAEYLDEYMDSDTDSLDTDDYDSSCDSASTTTRETLIKYVVYKTITRLVPVEGEEDLLPETVGAFTSLIAANEAAHNAVALHATLAAAMSWSHSPDGLRTATLTNDTHTVKVEVLREIVQGRPPPRSARRLPRRVFEVLISNDGTHWAPVSSDEEVYSSVEQANSMAAKWLLEKMLPLQKQVAGEARDQKLWEAMETQKVREMQHVCDAMGEGVKEVRSLVADGEEIIWRVEVRDRKVMGPLN